MNRLPPRLECLSRAYPVALEWLRRYGFGCLLAAGWRLS
ncbi:Uncharacterised protein [Vibrio cholerae]|nr:Uncharacterised protein [Vibrio cholerae]